jgi:hypothetical protein
MEKINTVNAEEQITFLNPMAKVTEVKQEKVGQTHSWFTRARETYCMLLMNCTLFTFHYFLLHLMAVMQ